YSEHELKFRESVGSKCKSVIFFALDGSLCFEAKAILPTNSRQNWGSILYGIDRDKFSFDNSDIEKGNYINDSIYSSIYKLLIDAGKRVVSLIGWQYFHSGLLEKNVVDSIFIYTPLEDENLYHVEMLKTKHECWVFKHDEYVVNKFKEIISTDEFANISLFVIHLTD
ncbi:8863_t:CDS:2, partial [Racocetra persica]